MKELDRLVVTVSQHTVFSRSGNLSVWILFEFTRCAVCSGSGIGGRASCWNGGLYPACPRLLSFLPVRTGRAVNGHSQNCPSPLNGRAAPPN